MSRIPIETRRRSDRKFLLDEIKSVEADLRQAEAAYVNTVKAAFPIGMRGTVHWGNAKFEAEVTRVCEWRHEHGFIVVKNLKTEKLRKVTIQSFTHQDDP